MNNINIKHISSIVIFLIAGIYVLTEVLTARTGIGQLYLYFAIAALFIGVLSPKSAMYLLGFCTIYIDFFKRLMVIGGTPTFVEVSYVLAIPPLLVAGTIISVILNYSFSDTKLSRDNVVAFAVATIIAFGSVAGLAIGLTGGDGLSGVGVMVNQGFYSYLIFTVPLLFPTDEDRRKYLHYFFCLMIPSLVYMFWQEYHGYAGFEYDYLMSGLSIEAKNLDESIGGELRKFSTLNGCGTASTLYSIFTIYCFVSLKKDNAPVTFFSKFGKTLLAPFFVLAAYYTISRTGWFSGLATILGFYMLGSRIRSYVAIISSLCTFTSIVLIAPIAIKHNWLNAMEVQLKYLISEVTDDPAARRAIVLGTMGDRLQGWANLTQESKLWTPFGFAAAGINYKNTTNNDFRWGHDALIDSLIKFGYVPVTGGLLLGLYLAYRLLKYMHSLPRNSLAFKITRLCLSLNAGILLGALSSAAQFRNFPQNFFFMLWLAIPFAAYQQTMRARKEARSSNQPDEFLRKYPDLVNISANLPASH